MRDTPSLDDEIGKLGSEFTQPLFFFFFLSLFLSFFFVNFLYSVYVQTKLTSTNLHIDTIQFSNNGGSKYIPFADVEGKNGEESEGGRERERAVCL